MYVIGGLLALAYDSVEMIIGRWSEESCCKVFQDVEVERVVEQKVMSGEEIRRPAWYGMCVCCCGLLSMYMLLSWVAMSVPLRSSMLSVYQAVFLALKSPAIIECGICVRGVSWGVYWAGTVPETGGI